MGAGHHRSLRVKGSGKSGKDSHLLISLTIVREGEAATGNTIATILERIDMIRTVVVALDTEDPTIDRHIPHLSRIMEYFAYATAIS